MYKNKKVLALITARKETKAPVYKNIKLCAGKPLIAWSIEEAKNSRYVDRIIVSTEDKGIAEISKKYDAEAPFLRPRHLALDNTKHIDIILHAMNWIEKKRESIYDLLVLLQPTCPLRTFEDIDNSIITLFQKKAKAVVSVNEVEHPPYWANILPKNGCMKNFLSPDVLGKNRQELPTFYRINGVVYVAYWKFLKQTKTFFGSSTYAYIMPKDKSIDIDDEIDFKFAELLMNYRQNK